MYGYCQKCGTQLVVGAKFCSRCGEDVEKQNKEPVFSPKPTVSSNQHQMESQSMNSTYSQSVQQKWDPKKWRQNFYRIRKKTLTVGNKYWLEDQNSKIIGFCKQKLFKLKEDIRIYTDESMTQELFRIKQQQITDAWGNFAVIDSATNEKLGFVKRNIVSAFVKDTWEVYNNFNQMVGKVEEKSTGHALARKYMPGGTLVPGKMHLMLNNQSIADVTQEFKIIGDIWTMNCHNVPDNFDRRVLLSCILLMGLIERRHK